MKNITSHIQSNEKKYIDELSSFIAIKSISASKKYKKDIETCAEFLSNHLEKIGMENVAVYSTPGNPIVYADWLNAPGKPTVLIYGHYDVQPAGDENAWHSPPFKLTVRDQNMYGRGISDDKGQLFCHIKSIEAFLKLNKKLPVNVKMIFEGEEEISSPSMPDFLKEHKDLLKSDVALISDTSMFAPDIPSLCFSLRGITYFEIELKGPNREIHSGEHGGLVRNPINTLSQILAKMQSIDGNVLIPGFYDDVLESDPSVKKDTRNLPFKPAEYMADYQIDGLLEHESLSPLEQVWFRPSFDIHGIFGGFMEEGSKTIIPSSATAKISIRLVPNQDPEKILNSVKNYIKSITPKGVKLTIKDHGNGRPILLERNTPAAKAAFIAMEKAFGKKPIWQGEGGSIPIVADFMDVLGVHTVLMGFNLPEDNIHSPNESFAVKNFMKGIEASALFLENYK